MRALVREILNPVLQKNEEEKERYLEISKKTQDFISRLEIIEYSYFNNKKNQKAPNLFDTIFQKITEIENERKLKNMEINDKLEHQNKLLSQYEEILSNTKDQFKQYIVNEQIRQDARVLSISETSDSFVDKINQLREQIFQMSQQIEVLDQTKLNVTRFTECCDKFDKLMAKLDDVAVNQQNKLITIENYCEKYVPVKIQTIVMDNIKLFVNKETMQKLKSQENKIFHEITDQLLNDDGKGSIFNNIMKINEVLSKRLSTAVDLSNMQKHQQPQFKYQSFQSSLQVQKEPSVNNRENNQSLRGTVIGGDIMNKMIDNMQSNMHKTYSVSPENSISNMPITNTNRNIQNSTQGDNNEPNEMQFMQRESEMESDEESVQSENSIKFLRIKEEFSEFKEIYKRQLDHFMSYIKHQVKEQQIYIQTIHQDFEDIEKKRTADYQEEESQRNKIMEDIVKLYQKIQDSDKQFLMYDKKFNIMSDKIIRMRQIMELKINGQVSQIDDRDKKDQLSMTQYASQNEYTTFTENSSVLDRRKKNQRQFFNSTRPSLSILKGDRTLSHTPHNFARGSINTPLISELGLKTMEINPKKQEGIQQQFQQVQIKLQSMNISKKEFDLNESERIKTKIRYNKNHAKEIESSEYNMPPSGMSMIQPTKNQNFHN
ncbi:UNKNOWN [Stylonychia lemnae]|uniref:Uncharacterized protein n=1 Tax=Stylonychia lemnae TaxID=5949 RepID=A0A077ZZ49_STYLE|nr:UNKNOWN [Stylonychia lemnae]|eukprot:CDW75226.1 UNKNOWN [Stylonychia lemnae]